VQGETALMRAAYNGEEAQVKQLIAAKANLNANDVIYRSCARVSLSECSEVPAPDITLKILCMLKFLVLIILHELSLCD
jgi:ankyrin repeat protein